MPVKKFVSPFIFFRQMEFTEMQRHLRVFPDADKSP